MGVEDGGEGEGEDERRERWRYVYGGWRIVRGAEVVTGWEDGIVGVKFRYWLSRKYRDGQLNRFDWMKWRQKP